jgi:hypothetical protein
MQKHNEIVKQITELNANYRAGSLGLTHEEYLKRYNALVRKAKNNPNSLVNQMKLFGAKSTREADYSGYYIYKGKNFNALYNQASCESTWWEVNLYNDNVDVNVKNHFEDYNYFDTKKDCLSALFELDKSI